MEHPEFYWDDWRDVEDGKIVFDLRISSYYTVPLNEYVASGDLDLYASLKPSILKRLRRELTVVSEEELTNSGINPEQFIFRTHDIEMRGMVGVNNNPDDVMMGKEIYITITVSIEDITGLEPEGDEALYAKFKYLCEHGNRENLEELEEWTRSIGIRYTTPPTKDQMCTDIRAHYGF